MSKKLGIVITRDDGSVDIDWIDDPRPMLCDLLNKAMRAAGSLDVAHPCDDEKVLAKFSRDSE